MIKLINSIAQENQDGFTFDITTKQLFWRDHGFIVAYKATQNQHGIEGIEFCLEHAKDHQRLIGGWFNKDNKQYYYDSVMYVEDFEDAVRLGKEHKQISIFSFFLCDEIKL